MRRLSNSFRNAILFFFTLVIFLFCLVLPGPLTAQEYGSISGTVYQNDGITPVQSDWGIAAFRASNHDFVSGSPIAADGTYRIAGLPPGDYLIRTEPSINHGAVMYYDNTPYFEQRSVITISGQEHITGIDFTLEYPIYVESVNAHLSDDTFDTFFGIYFFYFQQFDIQRVVSITLEDPLGNRYDWGDQNDFTITEQFTGFTLHIPGKQPEYGDYTLSVETEDFSTTMIHTRTGNTTLPVVNASTMFPADNSTITSSMPVFSWASVENPQMTVYYRLQVFDDTGYRVFASQPNADILSMTMSEGVLQPEQTYTWRVDIYDDPDLDKRDKNSSRSQQFSFTMADTLSTGQAAPPAVSLDGWGAVSWRSKYYDATSMSVKVIDHDGIAYDGSSHQVEVTFDGQTKPLFHSKTVSAFEAYYEYWDGNTPAPAGDYVFSVTDPEGNVGTTTDTLILNSLEIVDHNASESINNGTSPTFIWDPVPDAVRYRVRIYDLNYKTLWSGFTMTNAAHSFTLPPGILEPDTSYQFRIDAYDTHSPLVINNAAAFNEMPFTTGAESENPLIEIAHGAATRNSPDQGAYLYFWTKVHDAQGVPGDIQSVTATFPGGGTIDLNLVDNESDTCGIYYAEDFGLPIAAGEYTITVTDLDGNTHSVSDILDVNLIDFPAEATVNAVVNGTRVDVTWEDIDWEETDEVAFYRLEIHDMDGNRLHNFNTIENGCVIPAGYLKENTVYQYRITTWREFFNQGVANSSRSVMKMFETGSNQDVSTPKILSSIKPDITISAGSNNDLFGTSMPNEITLESGAQAKMMHFPGSNLIIFQSDAALFEVSHSGTMVTFQGSDGTSLKVPATMDEQTIMFNEKGPLVLRIHENQVRLNDQVIGRSPALIAD